MSTKKIATDIVTSPNIFEEPYRLWESIIHALELVITKEREACAQIADGYADTADPPGVYKFQTSKRKTSECIAAAIRRR